MDHPLPDTPFAREIMFFACIGRLTVAWAHLEAGLDMMVDITRHLGGDQIEAERPIALKRKLKYLGRYFSSIGMPDAGLVFYQNLFREIMERSDFRHDIIHGALSETGIEYGQAKFMRFLHKDGKLNEKPINVNADRILAAAKEAETLSKKTLKWVTAATEEIVAQFESHASRTR